AQSRIRRRRSNCGDQAARPCRAAAARRGDDRSARDVRSRGCRVDQDVVKQAIIEYPVAAADDGLVSAEETWKELRRVRKTEARRHVVAVRLLHDAAQIIGAELAQLGRDGRIVEHVQRAAEVLYTAS